MEAGPILEWSWSHFMILENWNVELEKLWSTFSLSYGSYFLEAILQTRQKVRSWLRSNFIDTSRDTLETLPYFMRTFDTTTLPY